MTKDSREELKACCFCDSKPLRTQLNKIACVQHACPIEYFGMSEEAWNTRPTEEALKEKIAELEKELGGRVQNEG